MFEGITAVYKGNVDLLFYVLGAQTENEVMARCCLIWHVACLFL